ncbi:WD repeat-containing protein 43-like [Prorops nasuta]|uniref:WD repeat-containing protein 43-like n=1 Tax=Prorops nasuta TaxID=863751 RepID=UPI0034CDBFD9
MASAGCSAFSSDGQYLAYCGNDGKLKIYETATDRLKQEYTPNLHLSSPCSVLCWISVSQQSTSIAPSPWKKLKKKSSDETDSKGIVAMGSVNGTIILYDTTSATVSNQLENGHVAGVTAITWSPGSSLFTAADDHQIVEWNIQENGIKCKWKSGKGKVTALAIVLDGKSLISAERKIKWWNLDTKELIRTFTGHAYQVTTLNPIRINSTTSYIVSGAQNEGYLCIWALNDQKIDKTSAATLSIQDDPLSVSVLITKESQVLVMSITRLGQALVFKYQPNGHCAKPLKPALNIAVASDSCQKGDIQQIPILVGKLMEDESILLAYGSYLNVTFEKVVPDFSEKIQCLIRSEAKKGKDKKDESILKVKTIVTDDNVEYLAPGVGETPLKRNRANNAKSQLLLKDRLENLSLNSEGTTTGDTPTKGKNMAQLLLQGLNSKDKSILTSVLFTKNENVIRNTVLKLPFQAIIPLLRELTTMLQGKTYPSQIAVIWLRNLISAHAAHLLSHPDVADSLSPILSVIDAKLMLLSDVSRLRGKVSLITGQISQFKENNNKDIMQESLLVYQDPDSSDEGTNMGDTDIGSESDENWEEISDQGENNEQADEEITSIKSGDNEDNDDDDAASMCS